MAISKIITSSLTDDAVTSAKIGTDQVGADALSSSAISGAVDIPANSVGQSELSIDLSAQSVPHIIPGVLYPGYNDKQIDGTTALAASTTGPAGSTVTSSKYGTVQSDGRMYYYTDIKGSKPIKDPRIGAHFGSQRHKTKSLQLLEQETAAHGSDVYTVDGREWMRAYGTWETYNTLNGNGLKDSSTSEYSYLEVVGYFSDISGLINQTVDSTDRGYVYKIDNGSFSAEQTQYESGVNSPLGSRYVDNTNLVSIVTGQTLGIHTITIRTNAVSDYILVTGIELIAQDLAGSGSPNRSKIKFPAQNVVSQGKKFAITETNHHYNPFAFAENGTTAVAIGDNDSHGKLTGGWSSGGTTAQHYDSTLDTTTSLGLEAWVDSGNYYRPVNGGRIVKWVDSTGTIKTSVNMMPPSAKSKTAGSGNAGPHQTAWTTTYQPVFSSGSIDNTQAEAPRNFHFREFGNGSANGGENGTWKDFSTVMTTSRDVTFVMDDGLTSLTGDDVRIWDSVSGGLTAGGTKKIICTFIGTGITLETAPLGSTANSIDSGTMAQNLPFGTHIFEYTRIDGSADLVKIDGVQVFGDTSTNGYFGNKFFHFHQPKMPPIPEDAVVLADYMLMSDFVPRNDSSADISLISKGVRRCNMSRDWFFGNTSGNALSLNASVVESSSGFSAGFGQGSGNQYKSELPSFCTNFVATGYDVTNRGNLFIDGVDTASTAIGGGNGTYGRLTNNVVLGTHKVRSSEFASGYNTVYDFDLVTPTHTSFHYQSFETPFLHELVGGDRNMEQNNLICSSDGKTWDEMTRDSSYIGNIVLSASRDGGDLSNTSWIYDWFRGIFDDTGSNTVQKKHWAISYDRFICLVDGFYEINITNYFSSADGHIYLNKNGTGYTTRATQLSFQRIDPGDHNGNALISDFFVRGDFINIYVGGSVVVGTHTYYNSIQIKKL